MTSDPERQAILIVDDLPENIDVLSMILGEDYKIKAAVNGRKALEIAESEPHPDIILLDVMMPGMNGYDVCRQLKSDERTREIPVIFVTAMSESEDQIAGFEVGAVDYITKPFIPTIVKARVNTHLILKNIRENLEGLVGIRTKELETAYEKLKSSQAQIVQQEKLASIGQLAAGVAHEINNPVGFISSNIRSFDKYVGKLANHIEELAGLANTGGQTEQVKELQKKNKVDFILEDIRDLIAESLEGTDRIQEIVRDLKPFSRSDEKELCLIDINECLESTLKIVWNELKYKTTVVKEFGELPKTMCYPQQLKQVFVNLLVNAAQAIEKHGDITIRTTAQGDGIKIAITDTGCGIPVENQARIFDPFFTTKESGKGTGLGMSISYDIVKKHNGEITMESEVGSGTTFTIELPVVVSAGE